MHLPVFDINYSALDIILQLPKIELFYKNAGAVLDYFNDFMDGLCTGFYTDADGFWDYGIDLSMKSFMQAKLLRAMLKFKP